MTQEKTFPVLLLFQMQTDFYNKKTGENRKKMRNSYTSISRIILTILFPLFTFSCDFKPSPPQNIKYEGISFQFPGNWKSECEVLDENLSHYIGCEEKGNSADLFMVTFIKDSIIPDAMIETYFENLQSSSSFDRKAIVENKFGDYDCVSSDYSFKVIGKSFYGVAYAFVQGEKSVMIVKQSDTKERLQQNFNMLEDSFKVE